jgi:hypothetical protein
MERCGIVKLASNLAVIAVEHTDTPMFKVS